MTLHELFGAFQIPTQPADRWIDIFTANLPFKVFSAFSAPEMQAVCQLPYTTFTGSRYLFCPEDGGNTFIRKVGS
jgi:hypothetical protein